MKEEGPDVVSAFLTTHPEFVLESPESAGFDSRLVTDGCLSMDPARHGSDGFFAARLRRASEPATPAAST